MQAKNGLSHNGGLFADDSGKVYRALIRGCDKDFYDQTSNAVCVYKSKPINFGSCTEKVLRTISIDACGNATLTVASTQGSKTFTLNKGANYFNCNLRGVQFTFEIIADSSHGSYSMNVVYA